MKIKNKEIFLNLAISIVSIVIIVCMGIYGYNTYTDTSNTYVNNIVNLIIEKYPDVSEEEIIQILNNPNINGENTILVKYGIKNDINYIKQLEEERNVYILMSILVIIVINICWLINIRLKTLKQKNQIEELSKYFQELNSKKYILNIDKNQEDNFTRVKNEIYKTTVMLNEIAEKNKEEKVNMSNILADISHQVKTPITSIKIMLDNIIDNPNMDENIKNEFINEISKQVDWISNLTITLLKLAKIDAGAIKMNIQKVNINNLIEEVIYKLKSIAEEKNIEIVKIIDKNIEYNLDYKWQLEAFINILKNAIEHSNSNSKIWIEVKKTNVYLSIKIRDEGIGIAKKDIKNIFNRFYKVSVNNSESIGIGLSISKSLIELCNGEIKVESKKEEGTTFNIKYLELT